MNDFAALAYLDGRQLVNTARGILRKPGRGLLYLLAIVYFVGLAWLRTHSGHAPIPGVPDPWASLLFFGVLLLFSFAVLRAASGNVAGFASGADARFLIGSRLDERNVVVWLQLRNSLRAIARLLFLILMYALLYRGAGQPLAIVLSMAASVAIGIGLAIPIFNLRRRRGAAWAFTLGWTLFGLALIGIASVCLAFALPQLTWLQTDTVGLGLGHIVTRAALGDPTVIVIGYLIAIALIAAGYVGSNDLYPELQVGSARATSTLARVRRGGGVATLGQTARAGHIVASSSAPRGFVGALAIVWKDWISSRRTIANVIFWIFLGLAAALGLTLGLVGMRGDQERAIALSFGFTAAIVLTMVGSFGARVTLQADIGKPLWWMGASTIGQRLYAWLLSTSWRTTACAAAAILAWAIVSSNPLIAVLGVPAAAIFSTFIRAVGLALYTLFPSLIDQRGPLAFARMLCFYAALAPPVAAGAIAGALGSLWGANTVSSVAEGVATAVAIAIVEIVALVAFAAMRIAKNGASFAQAEAT